MTASISKSKYLGGLQCPRLLWTQYHDPGAVPGPDAAQEAVFATGHTVGDLAKGLWPGGVEVPLFDRDLARTVAETSALLKRRVPVFEASFLAAGGYCRADILAPADGGAWDLYEVKSSTRVKDVNIADVALQAHVIEAAGVRLDRLHLVHVDTSYVRRGEIDPQAYFHMEDVTARARAWQPRVAADLEAMHGVIAGERPDTPIGEHCFKPYGCDLWGACSGFLPEPSVLDLHRVAKSRAFAWIAEGRTGILDISPGDLSAAQVIQREAVRTGEAYVDSAAIRGWLSRLEYPIHCLDFETMNPAIPLVEGTRPYQQVPFQLSLHVIETPGAEPVHVEFLAEAPGDPRPGVIAALKAIGPLGTILAYNAPFEQRVIRELTTAFPAEAPFLRGLPERFEDLMTPFARFWRHDARQAGSASLKAVLPTVSDMSYADMEIGDGGTAARAFTRAVFGDLLPQEQAATLADLRTYCRQDTLALVAVLGVLRREAGAESAPAGAP